MESLRPTQDQTHKQVSASLLLSQQTSPLTALFRGNERQVPESLCQAFSLTLGKGGQGFHELCLVMYAFSPLGG